MPFILSLRAVGEGHISLLTFRCTIAADGSVAVDPTARLATVPKITSRTSKPIGDDIGVALGPEEELSERVIFPITVAQSNGIEDARFVEFNGVTQKHSTQRIQLIAAGPSVPSCLKAH